MMACRLLRFRIVDGIVRFVVVYLNCWCGLVIALIVIVVAAVETVLHPDKPERVIPERINLMLQGEIKVRWIAAREARVVP